MTEIPEHLRKRAEEARIAAGGSPRETAPEGAPTGLPNLLSPSLDQAEPANPHDALDWTRFGTRPSQIAGRVLDFVSGKSGDEGYSIAIQRFGDTNDDRELHALSQVVTREIGDALHLRIGHVMLAETEKATGSRIVHGARKLSYEFLMGVASGDYIRYTGVDTTRDIDVDEFRQASETEGARKHSYPWAELLVDVNGPDERGIDMLTAFGMQLAENSVDDPENLAERHWGSSALVIHPMQAGNGLSHHGYNSLWSLPHVNDDATLTNPSSRYGARGTFRWVGGESVNWRKPSDSTLRPPTVTDVIETAMNGIEASMAMMQDPDIHRNADEHNRVLQSALSNFA